MRFPAGVAVEKQLPEYGLARLAGHLCVFYDFFRRVSFLIIVSRPGHVKWLYIEKDDSVSGRFLDVLMVSEKEAVQCRVVPILNEMEGWRFDATDD